jgi:hypothetical protein
MLKLSSRKLEPRGGVGKGEARLTAESAALSSDRLPLERVSLA